MKEINECLLRELQMDGNDVPVDGKVTGHTVQLLLWSDVYEERVYLSNKTAFTRLVDESSDWKTKFFPVRDLEVQK